MKTKNPYGANDMVKVPPDTIENEMKQAGMKAKARYPHKPLGTSQMNGEMGKMGMKGRALTPGSTPSGS